MAAVGVVCRALVRRCRRYRRRCHGFSLHIPGSLILSRPKSADDYPGEAGSGTLSLTDSAHFLCRLPYAEPAYSHPGRRQSAQCGVTPDGANTVSSRAPGHRQNSKSVSRARGPGPPANHHLTCCSACTFGSRNRRAGGTVPTVVLHGTPSTPRRRAAWVPALIISSGAGPATFGVAACLAPWLSAATTASPARSAQTIPSSLGDAPVRAQLHSIALC